MCALDQDCSKFNKILKNGDEKEGYKMYCRIIYKTQIFKNYL